jgi:hypothetical protein
VGFGHVQAVVLVGVQALASYDVHPTAMAENAPELLAGLQWQPSASCSEQPGLAGH